MHPKKIQSISSLKPEDRFDFFIRKVADFEVVWGLYDEGWATSNLNMGEVVPFWPEGEFASQCATGMWSNFLPRTISVQDFLHKWLPGMRSDSRLCQVFPVPEDVGLVISPAELETALREELGYYE